MNFVEIVADGMDISQKVLDIFLYFFSNEEKNNLLKFLEIWCLFIA